MLDEVDKYKALLMAKGYSQLQGVDYIEVFAPVARMTTVRIIPCCTEELENIST